jgi:putative ABC transport system permease protein
VFLAWREIKRAKLRFGLLTFAVALLVALVFVIQGLTAGLITQFVGALRNQDADVLVYGEQARRNLEGSIITPDQMRAIEETLGPEARVGPLGQGTFTVVAGDESEPGRSDLRPSPAGCAPSTLEEGRLPERDGEAVASEADAAKGFGMGSRVVVQPGGQPITVVGLAESIRYSVAPTLFVSFDTYVEARKVRNPDALEVYPTAAAVEPAPGVSDRETVDTINAAVEGVEALTRDEAVNGSPGVAVRQSLGLVVWSRLIVPIVAGFFFVILTVQKSASLTLLRAIGASTAKLVGSLALQAALVLGGGIVLALALVALAGVFMTGDVGIELSAVAVVVISSVVTVLSAVALVAAIRRVLAIDPIAATHSQGIT